MLPSISLPETITELGKYAFEGCKKLTEVNFPANLATIGNGAFSECTGLTSVSLPETVVEVCDSTFTGCNHYDITIEINFNEVEIHNKRTVDFNESGRV